MPLLPEFVQIVPNASNSIMGSGFILHSIKPYYLGRIVKLKPGDWSVHNYLEDMKPLVHSVTPGYCVVIAFAGNLEGYKVRLMGPDWHEQLQRLFDRMADWYLKDKILLNLSYYKKFKNP